MAVLYVETNLLIAVATGRAPLAHILLDRPPPHIHLAVPGICFFEGLQWMGGEARRREELRRKLEMQFGEVERDMSGAGKDFLFHLGGAVIQNSSYLQFVNERLFWAIERLSLQAEILAITPADLEASRLQSLIPDLTDNLILHSVLAHSRSAPEVDKAIFSENKRDFRRPEARGAMAVANLTYLATSEDMMRWVDSRPGADPGWRTFYSDDHTSGTLD